MSNGMISLLTALGIGAWIYAKMYRSSGGNRVNAMVVSGGAGLVVFLAMMAILNAIF